MRPSKVARERSRVLVSRPNFGSRPFGPPIFIEVANGEVEHFQCGLLGEEQPQILRPRTPALLRRLTQRRPDEMMHHAQLHDGLGQTAAIASGRPVARCHAAVSENSALSGSTVSQNFKDCPVLVLAILAPKGDLPARKCLGNPAGQTRPRVRDCHSCSSSSTASVTRLIRSGDTRRRHTSRLADDLQTEAAVTVAAPPDRCHRSQSTARLPVLPLRLVPTHARRDRICHNPGVGSSPRSAPLQHRLAHLTQQAVRAEQLDPFRLRPRKQFVRELRIDQRRFSSAGGRSGLPGHDPSVSHRVVPFRTL